ncbi:MAG: glycosyltransferase family 1 protein [Pseudomonadota bacterium]
MQTIYINGKFSAQPLTGVQRFASGMVSALDELLHRGEGLASAARWVLLCPTDSTPPVLRVIEVRSIGSLLPSLHFWEQLALPLAARSGLLLSFAGSAPLLARRQVATLHDAAVFDQPATYGWLFRSWYRFLFRALARSAKGLLTVSKFSQQRLAATLGLNPEVIGVLGNGAEHFKNIAADDSLLLQHGLQPGTYFLAVGSLSPGKNLARLMAAFEQQFAGRDVRLVMVGGGNAQVFAGDALPATTPAQVLRLAKVSDAQLKALYQHAIALVFPSLYEGFGLPPVEAMHCGCPVAASDAAAMPEVCGEAALYFDPTSVQAIAAAMRRLQDEPALRQQLRQRGHAQSARHRWSSSAQHLMHWLSARQLLGAAA